MLYLINSPVFWTRSTLHLPMAALSVVELRPPSMRSLRFSANKSLVGFWKIPVRAQESSIVLVFGLVAPRAGPRRSSRWAEGIDSVASYTF